MTNIINKKYKLAFLFFVSVITVVLTVGVLLVSATETEIETESCEQHDFDNGTCLECGFKCTHPDLTWEDVFPTCTEEGYLLYHCPDCSWSEKNDWMSALGHTPGAAATCTTPQTCTECGEVLALAIGHDFDNGTCLECGFKCTHPDFTWEDVFPTCTEEGYLLYHCPDCSWSEKNDWMSALGHTPGAVATCTTPQTCTECGKVLASAKGHNPGAVATCTTPQTCTECGEVLALAIGHDFDNGACRLCGVQCAHSETEYLYTKHKYDENEGYAHIKTD